MRKGRNDKTNNFLAVLAVAILVAVIGHAVSVVSYNRELHVTSGADESSETYMSIGERGDSTSSWLKRDFELNGSLIDLSAQTFDAVLSNNAKNAVSDWNLTLNIKDDCYINNAWCGTVEIHQHNGSKNEKVQTLDLRNYNIEDVELDYSYDGDLLIPLSRGDYIVYYPSSADNELPVGSGSELTMGFIFYYPDTIDLSDYKIGYNYHRSWFSGPAFYAILVLVIIWISVLFAQIISDAAYKKAVKEMELRRSGVSYVSDIYYMMYIADIVNDELTVINGGSVPAADEVSRKGAVNYLRDLFISDVTDEYRNVVSEFMDPSTLEQRFDRGSIACQYTSITKGWCLCRLFAMDRGEGEPLRRFIFTLQNINEEKTEMDRIEESIAGAEPEQPSITLDFREYSLRDLIGSVLSDTEEAAALKGIEVASDISPKIPDVLTGDPGKLRMAISCMLLSAIKNTESGSIKLSVFCKETKEGKAHILVSVKDTGGGREPAENDMTGLGLNAASEILAIMDSELHAIREKGGGSELYFETEQTIA